VGKEKNKRDLSPQQGGDISSEVLVTVPLIRGVSPHVLEEKGEEEKGERVALLKSLGQDVARFRVRHTV